MASGGRSAAHALRRHRGKECRLADAADRPRALVRDIMLVDEEHIERAVNAYLTLQKTMAEGAGAAGLAAMLAEPKRFAWPQGLALVLCGGNIDRASSSLDHGARARARGPHRVLPAHHCRPAVPARPHRNHAWPARRQYPRGRSPADVSRCAARARAWTSRSKRAMPRMPRNPGGPSKPTALRPCGSIQATPWKDALARSAQQSLAHQAWWFTAPNDDR